MKTRTALSAFIGILFTACGSSTEVEVASRVTSSITSVEPASGAGYTVGIRLTNEGSSTVGVSTCYGPLQRKSADTWISVDTTPSGGVCAAVVVMLEPGKSLDFSLTRMDLHPSDLIRFYTDNLTGERHSPAWPSSAQVLVTQ